MSGTCEGGRKAAATNYAKHGKDFYKIIGKKGGSAIRTRPAGFASMTIGRDGLTGPERARIAGARGGRKSRKRGQYKKERYSPCVATT